jgi:hypothetical protein
MTFSLPEYLPPDWKVWRSCRNIEVWEGIALSLNLDPIYLRKWCDDPVYPRFRPEEQRLQREYQDRLFVASRYWSGRGPNGDARFHSVPISELLAFLPEDWEIPNELSKLRESVLPKPSESESSKPRDTLSTREKNTLLTIVAGLCYAARIDWRERGAAARIARLTEEKGAPVSEDTVRRYLDQISGALDSRIK